MKLIILLITAIWYNSSNFGYAQAGLHKNIRTTPRRHNKVWKRQDDLGYLEQCSILQFWEEQVGKVNVLAFFDSSWQFSHRQAAMLRVLRERFNKTGFDNIQFFVVNAAPNKSQYVDASEIEVEEETWKQISPSEAEGLPPVVLSPEDLYSTLGPEVYFIQDNEELQIWSKLRAFRDQILVIDRCGRLTYQVIVPWSILHFPYVKAAILSTYKDKPCGYCQEPSFDTNENDNPQVTAEESSTSTTESENNYTTITTQEPSTITSQYESYDMAQSSEESFRSDTQTDSTQSFETTTVINDISTSDTNENNFSNTINEYTDDYSNLTTREFESTTKQFIIEVTDRVLNDNITEQQMLETETPTTTEKLNSDANIKVEETKLKETDEIESIDAHDVLKSRSTNARSVSPNDGTENQLINADTKSERSGEQDTLESELFMPIRIIMRAPHTDEYSDRTMKTHEYLVLKTGQPNYHEHLESEVKPGATDGEQQQRPANKKIEIVRRTFGKDESPGLYGEVADYWSNFGNGHVQDSTLSSDDEDEQVLEHETGFTDEDTTLTPSTVPINAGRENTESSNERPEFIPADDLELDNENIYNHDSDFKEEVDIVDEEAKSKLIAHYSKLLPWLYYVLAK